MNSILGQAGDILGNTKRAGSSQMAFGTMPQWKSDPESFADSFARTIPDIGLMLVLIVLFFAGAYFSFRRYDVR